MRNRCLLGGLVWVSLISLVAVPVALAEALTPDSKITAVTVYPGSARVTRQAAVQLTPGKHTVEFADIIPTFDENSLSVNGSGRASVLIHGAHVKTEYLTETADERTRELQQQMQDISDQLQAVAEQEAVIQQQAEFLNSIKLYAGQQIPKDLVTAMPSTESLSGLLGFIGENGEQLSARRQGLAHKRRELQKEQTRLGQEIAKQQSSAQKVRRSVLVDVECKKAGELNVEVAFLVYGANWRPVYDARAHIDDAQVELIGYAQVQQTTGEDWSKVDLELSTSRPTVSGQLPYVAPWVLQPYQHQPKRSVSKVASSSAVAGVQYEPQYFAEEDLMDSAQRSNRLEKEDKAKLAYSKTQHKGISVVFAVPQPATIPTDGSEYKFPISTQKMAANFSYSTYPRATTLAYLGSRVKNSPDLQLLAGEVNLFLDGDYVGKSAIKNIGPGEEFDLSLGIDESVKVKREQLKKNVDDVLLAGFKSPNIKVTIQQKITVENYKQQQANIIIYEAMPVSQNDRIKVRIDGVSPQPVEKDWNDRKGVWRWELKLPAGGKQEIIYSYLVEYPRDMQMADL